MDKHHVSKPFLVGVNVKAVGKFY